MLEGILVNVKSRGPLIDLFIRTSEGRKKVTVVDYRPYFFVEDPNGEVKTILGTKARKIICDDPGEVPARRQEFERLGIRHYEANIPYILRFLIDVGVYSGIRIETEGDRVSWKHVKPSKTKVESKLAFLDIEVYTEGEVPDPDEAENPVISYTIYSPDRRLYVSGVYHPSLTSGSVKRDGWLIFLHNSERELLTTLARVIEKLDFDTMVGWNVGGFDYPYLANRFKKVGINFDIEEYDYFDLMVAYDLVFDPEKVSLKFVAKEEGLTESSEEEPEHFTMKWWNEGDIWALLQYNKRDVEWTFKIFEKHPQLYQMYKMKKEIAGVPFFRRYKDIDIFSQKCPIDILHLRVAKEEIGVVLLTNPISEKKSSYKGAYVHQPEPGIYRNVAVFDFSQYYPSIILNFKLDPLILCEYYRKYDKFDLKKYIEFAKSYESGVILNALKRMIKLRKEIDKQLEKALPGTREYEELSTLKQAVKGIINSFYGVLGYEKFRSFFVELASSVTAIGRDGILAIKRRVEELGYRFRYGDTDSCMIQCPFERAEKLAEELTSFINHYFCKKYGVETDIKLKFEKYFASVLFLPKKGEESEGAKKRYAFHCIWEGKECDYIGYKGLEIIRSDSSRFTKQMLSELLEKVLRTENVKSLLFELPKWLEKKVQEFKRSPLSKIAIPKGISKPFDQYESKQAHIRGAIYANLYMGAKNVPGQKTWMLYVKGVKGLPKTDVVALHSPEEFEKWEDKIIVDWAKMLEISVYGRVEQIFKVVGAPLIRCGSGRQMRLV